MFKLTYENIYHIAKATKSFNTFDPSSAKDAIWHHEILKNFSE